MRADDLPHVTATAQRLGGLLARPCTCSRPDCSTIGDHIWHATRDASPGITAASLEPARSTTPRLPLPPPDPERTATAHAELQRLLTAFGTASHHLELFLGPWRPDREHPTPVAEPADWCAHHLALIGTHEPRYRGDLCRRCYDFGRAEGFAPTGPILQAWHRGERLTDRFVREQLAEVRAAAAKANRKKRAKK